MNETSKLLRIWNPETLQLLEGQGIDIGCGPDPVTPRVRRFDLEDGDANHITRFVSDRYDFVFSSHCLEHMVDPRAALKEWWHLVKPGGHLIFIVPDEDLYEQGVWPSRFNGDHKHTFTISKAQSWSPVSVNVLDLVHSLPGAEVKSLVLQDHGYDRALHRHGMQERPPRWLRRIARVLERMTRLFGGGKPYLSRLLESQQTVDQSLSIVALGQIQCILRKASGDA